MTSRIRCNLFSKAWRNDPATSRLPVQGWRSRHGGGRVHDRGVFALGGEIDNGAGQLEHLHRVVTGDVTHPPRRVRVVWSGASGKQAVSGYHLRRDRASTLAHTTHT